MTETISPNVTVPGQGQWRRWSGICFAGQLLSLPCIPLLTGRWSPGSARADADAGAHNDPATRDFEAVATAIARTVSATDKGCS